MKNKVLVGCLLFVGLFTVGCGSSSSDTETIVKTPPPVLKETVIDLPSEINTDDSEGGTGETIVALYTNQKDEVEILSRKFSIYDASEDPTQLFVKNTLHENGKWSRTPCPWAENITQEMLGSSISFDVDVELGVLYALTAKADYANPEKMQTKLYAIDMVNNSIKKVKLEGFPDIDFKGTYINSASMDVCSEDGSVILYCENQTGKMSLKMYNLDTGKQMCQLPVMTKNFANDLEYAYIVSGQDILAIDKQTGSCVNRIKLDQGVSGECKVAIAEGGYVYAMNHNGIYTAQNDNTKMTNIMSSKTLPILSDSQNNIKEFLPFSDTEMYAYYGKTDMEKGTSSSQFVKYSVK